MLYEDAIIMRVIRGIVFQSFCVDFPVTDKEVFGNYENFVMNLKISAS